MIQFSLKSPEMKAYSSSCTLPPLSNLLMPPHRPASSVLDVRNLLSPPPTPEYRLLPESPKMYFRTMKAKRKRASPAQLSVLNHVFSQTYFPSTELRIELGKQLGMNPRAVQIWFQNKRQSLRTRERQQSANRCPSLPSMASSHSSPEQTTRHYHHDTHWDHSSTVLAPLQLPPTPPPSFFPSPTSIDAILHH